MKKIYQLFLLTALAALSLAGASQAQASSKKVLKVATDSDTAPFTYKKDDKFKGYDIDLIKAIFKHSNYKVTFQTVPFDTISTGIDAGKYDLAANDFNYNKERAEKYLFSDPVSKSNYAVTGAKGKKYASLNDLSGKTTEALSGSNYAQILENWNKENPNKKPITVNYVSGTTGISNRLKDIENGKIDFILYDAISSSYIVKDQGLDLTVSPIKESLGESTDGLEYILLPKDEEGKKLQKFINRRIKVLLNDGTLLKLSKTYFGGDYVSTINKD